MSDYSADLALWGCAAINAMVFAASWQFATRYGKRQGSAAVFDAALFSLAVQYAAVCLPGILHYLTGPAVWATAGALSSALVLAGIRSGPAAPAAARPPSPVTVLVVSFTIALVAGFSAAQASLPVVSNDALTYHFPAAAQWVRQRRIDIFPTWFFNPANAYSPLAGSASIVWWMIPFGTDIAARFVALPALAFVGLGVYRLGREAGARAIPAALLASAAVLAGPVFAQGMMGKDDLYLAGFFLAAVVALATAGDKLGPPRLGAAVGLLLATKFTAWLAAPVLLLELDCLRGWTVRRGSACAGCVLVLAGPWYLRNWARFGNPFFPTSFLKMPGLCTVRAVDVLRHWRSAAAVVAGGTYGLSLPLACTLGVLWALSFFPVGKKNGSTPLLRICRWGPLAGAALFFGLSPFAEVRFLLPALLLSFAAVAWLPPRTVLPLATILFVTSAATLWSPGQYRGKTGETLRPLLWTATAIACGTATLAWCTIRWSRRKRQLYIGVPVGLSAAVFAFVYWTAYSRNYEQSLAGPNAAYQLNYPAEAAVWAFVNATVPATATVAYTNLYLVYPLQGPRLGRGVVYVPTRRGLDSMDELPFLGSRLTGDQVVQRATAETVADPDRAQWFKKLKASAATFLVVGRHGPISHPIEQTWADAAGFVRVFDSPGGLVYAVPR